MSDTEQIRLLETQLFALRAHHWLEHHDFKGDLPRSVDEPVRERDRETETAAPVPGWVLR